MPTTRREFLRRLGSSGAALALAPAISARGLEASAGPPLPRSAGPVIRIDSNENPYGPSAAALEAIRASLSEASRYPGGPESALRAAIAAAHGVPPEAILVGCGSTEILRVAVLACCGPDRPLVTAAPTFEHPGVVAGTVRARAVNVPVTGGLALDLAGMARAAAPDAGLVFCCNPNNPTATVHGADAIRRFVTETHAANPRATILIDEAYHEYVEDPAYATAVPLAMADPLVVVCRTLSKVHGLAGIRAGYAIARPETIERLAPWRMPNGISVAAGAAALASLGGTAHVARQQRLNREAKAFTRGVFEELGFRAAPSETNFLMVDIRRDAREFKAACLARGVSVGRAFPPLLRHARISIGTMEEMQEAANVFRTVLAHA